MGGTNKAGSVSGAVVKGAQQISSGPQAKKECKQKGQEPKVCRTDMATAHDNLKKLKKGGNQPKKPEAGKKTTAPVIAKSTKTQGEATWTLMSSKERVHGMKVGHGEHNGKNWVISSKSHQSKAPAQRAVNPNKKPQASQGNTTRAAGPQKQAPKRQPIVIEIPR